MRSGYWSKITTTKAVLLQALISFQQGSILCSYHSDVPDVVGEVAEDETGAEQVVLLILGLQGNLLIIQPFGLLYTVAEIGINCLQVFLSNNIFW